MKFIKKISAIATTAVLLMSMVPNCVNAAFEYNLKNWRGVSFANITEGEQAEIFVDTKEKHSGDASLYIKYNESYTANHFLQIMIGGKTVSSEKKYKLSYWIKVKNMGGVNPHFSWDWTAIKWITDTSNGEWVYQEDEFQPTADNFYLNLFAEDTLEMWIDDISVTEIGGSGENLVKNGDLEECTITPADEVTNADGLAFMNSVRISWQNPDDEKLYGVRIYSVDDNNNETLVFSDDTKEKDEVTIENLENDKTAKFLIKTVSIYGRESDGVFVFATPVNDAFVADKTSIAYKNGKLAASTAIYNYYGQEEQTATLILAVYKDGKMIGVKTQEKVIAKGSSQKYFIALNCTEEDVDAEVYLCDTADNLKPLAKTIYK